MKFVNPMTDTAEGKLLAIVKDIEKSLGIAKNMTCMNCKDTDEGCPQCNGNMRKALMSEKDKYCQKNFGCKYSECSAEQKAQCDKVHGKVEKSDSERHEEKMRRRWRPDDAGDFKEGLAEYDPNSYRDFDWDSVTEEDLDAWGTSDENMDRQYGGMGRWNKDQLRGSSSEGPKFARFMHGRRGPGERGAKMQEMFGKEDATREFIRKYVQESSGDNVKPMFMEISGKTEIPASGYQGNQHLPYTEDASESKAISEVFKMPSVAQTGYDTDASSLHMHYNDGGTGGSMYRDKIEESLAEIKKQATVGQQGVVEEIAGLIESIYARL